MSGRVVVIVDSRESGAELIHNVLDDLQTLVDRLAQASKEVPS